MNAATWFGSGSGSGSGSAEDLLVHGVRIGGGDRVLDAGTTWLAIHALADGVAEETETLRLRLEPHPAPNPGPGWGGEPPAVEFTQAELEVVIRDRDAAGACRDVLIAGTTPRKVTVGDPERSGSCGYPNVFETEVTVEADRGAFLQLDRITSYGLVDGWRVETRGMRNRHHLRVQWLVEVGWPEMRFAPCPLTGEGPTLVCTFEACEVYPAGSPLPAPRRPSCR